uniref:hypothetical protein n=1 Tax=Pseudoruegeria sp. HB172150 TaxID=2721164 RepID=UPI00352D1FCD
FLSGGVGNDTLWGAGGTGGAYEDLSRDVYAFGDHVGTGTDTIVYFEDGRDIIFLVGFHITDIGDSNLSISYDSSTNESTIVATDDNVLTIIMRDFDARLLTNDDFYFWA